MKGAFVCALLMIAWMGTRPAASIAAAPQEVGAGEDAPLPPGVSVRDCFDLSKAQWTTSATRARVCINGLWRFWPDANGGQVPAAGSGWCWMKVPGHWPSSHRWGHNPYDFVPIMSQRWQERFPVDVDRGDWRFENRLRFEPGADPGKWIPFDAVSSAWYQREIQVPRQWAGRSIYLTVETAERAGAVYIGDRKVADIAWPGGEIDVSDYVTPGSTATLSILVTAKPAGVRGLAGDVYLESRPKAVQCITDLNLVTSFRHKTLEVDVDLAEGLAKQALEVVATVSREGKTEKVFRSALSQPDGTTRRLHQVFPWTDAMTWDEFHPTLYEISVAVVDQQGHTLDATLPVTFGFREVWIEGRDILLNGRKLSLAGYIYNNGATMSYATSELTTRAVRRLKQLGYNLLLGSAYRPEPGMTYYDKQIYNTCNERGMFVQMQLPSAFTYMPRNKAGVPQYNAAAMQRWREDCRKLVHRYRFYPSVIFWSTNQGAYAGADMNNPRHWAQAMMPKLRSAPGMPDEMFAIIQGADEILLKLDPTRIPMELGNGGISRVISSVFIYPNQSPVQEVSEYTSLWAQKGSKPLLMSEWGTPMLPGFTSHRKNNPPPALAGTTLDAYFVEYDAMRRGEAAYHLAPAHEALYRHLDQGWYNYQQLERFVSDAALEQGFVRTQARTVQRVVPLWRADGVSMIQAFAPYSYWATKPLTVDHWPMKTRWDDLQKEGLQPDNLVKAVQVELHLPPDLLKEHFKLTSFAAAHADVMRPVLGFIGGDLSADGGLANVQHNYEAGTTLRKTLVLLNASDEPVTRVARWSLTMENRPLAAGQVELRATAGGSARAPLSVPLPSVDGGAVLSVNFVLPDGSIEQSRRMDIDLVRPQRPAAVPTLWLLDSKHTTAPALQRLGIPFKPITSAEGARAESVRAEDVVLIGERALDVETDLSWLKALPSPTKLLVLEQSGEVLSRRLGFRYGGAVHRRAFACWNNHPTLKGIAPDLLHDFAGSGSLIPAYPDMTSAYHYGKPVVAWLGLKPARMYHWGNTGSVCTFSPFKPDRGNFTTILDAGFDLNEAPLLWYESARAMVLFSQLDLASRTAADPIADQLLVNCIQAVAAAEPRQASRCVVLESRTADLLHTLGLEAQVVRPETLVSRDVLVLAGAHWPDDPAMRAIGPWLAQGGRVLTLAANGPQLSALLGRHIATRAVEAVGLPQPRDWPGLSAADVFWHGHQSFDAILSAAGDVEAGGGLVRLTAGRGTVDALQITPEQFDLKQRPAQRRALIKTRRLVRSLLTLRGCDSSAPVWNFLTTAPKKDAVRWNEGYYIDPLREDDDPYRYQNW